MSPQQVPDEATLVDGGRGELADDAGQGGHTLIWLWPAPGPLAGSDPLVHRSDGHLAALELRPGEALMIKRGVTDAPTLTRADGGEWIISVPSGAPYGDVSRAPTRLELDRELALTVSTQARGPQRFWLDLAPVEGPCGPLVLPPWGAVAVGPAVLWHVPQVLTAARVQIQAAGPGGGAKGFRCFSEATAGVVTHLRRRATMQIQVPKSAAVERWEARQPFILSGEPGCGKTTLAKAVYSAELGRRGFAAVHPVAVEQEIDLVALTGCASFAHDGVKVPDQDGHLDVLTHEDGVVLLDEVHTLDERLKKHLIDLLTEWTFRPRGDTTRRKRIRGLLVFATNQLDVLRDPRRFPADLFARMGGEPGIIEVPPLRGRRWEVPRLAEAVLEGLRPALQLSPNARRKLLLHSWPHNHWELEDVVREAHSSAAAAGQAVIEPQLLKVKPPPPPCAAGVAAARRTTEAHPPAPSAGRPSRPIDRGDPQPWRFPEAVGWAELFEAIHHLGSFAAVRDTWQQQLGARNAAAVNRRVGRLMRCDRCEPASCPRCFVGLLAQHEAEAVVEQLERVGRRTGVPQLEGWIVDGLRELVVERLEAFRQPAARAALTGAATTRARPDVVGLVATLQRLL